MRAISSNDTGGVRGSDRAAIPLFLLALSSQSELEASEASVIDEIAKNNYKILVIDDDHKFRKSFCFKLRRVFKAQVDEVERGMLGVERVKSGNTYDFIFTDIMMPEMTGIETYHLLRKIDAGIRIVMMSAYSDSEEWKKAQALKDIPLLHKPIPEDALIRVLGGSAKE